MRLMNQLIGRWHAKPLAINSYPVNIKVQQSLRGREVDLTYIAPLMLNMLHF